jgi:hypothetical protein
MWSYPFFPFAKKDLPRLLQRFLNSLGRRIEMPGCLSCGMGPIQNISANEFLMRIMQRIPIKVDPVAIGKNCCRFRT